MITEKLLSDASAFFREASDDYHLSLNKQEVVINRIKGYLLSHPDLSLFFSEKDPAFSEFRKGRIDCDFSIVSRVLKNK